MSMFWVAVLVLSTTPPSGGGASVDSPQTVTKQITAKETALPPARAGRELEEAVRDALRRWGRTSDKDVQAAAHELLTLFCDLQQDTRLAPSQRDELRTKVRGRLTQLSIQITKRLQQEAYQAKHGPKSVRVAKEDKTLGQMGAGFGGGQVRGAGTAPANDDAGPQLVELIQTTIAPKTWEANGGPGTISYWRQQRAIIARTTAEVHEEISDVVEQLNRASR